MPDPVLLYRRGVPQGFERVTGMAEPINLDPRYSTRDIPGRCIKCLAEQELNNCLIELLKNEGDDRDLQRKFGMLLAFLKSPESRKLRDESERYLSEGRQVRVSISFQAGKLRYELKVD